MKKLAASMDRILGEGAFEVLAKAKALEREGREVLHFEIGEPDFETPENIADAGIKAIKEGKTHYVPSDGITELKEAVCEHILKTRGYRPDVEQVLILPGVKPGIYFSMVSILEPKDEVIFQDPSFPTYRSLVRYIGAKEVPIPLLEENEFRMSPEDIKERITEHTKLIIINSPQNPTGSVLTKREVEEIAEIAEEHDIFLLSDEIYSQMTYGVEHYSATKRDEARERSILLDGFSKAYAMTGWRLGYCIAPKKLIEKMTLLLINAVSCTAPFVQIAGIEALRGPQHSLKEMMNKFAERRNAIVEGLNSIKGFSCLYPAGAFYAFPNIKATGMNSRELADLLLYEAGVAVLPGTAFGEAGEGYLRFSYATSVETIERAIERIKSALH